MAAKKKTKTKTTAATKQKWTVEPRKLAKVTGGAKPTSNQAPGKLAAN